MKKLKWLLIISALGLASCNTFPSASSSGSSDSTSEEPSSSSEPASTSVSSSDITSISTSSEEPGNDYLIDYQDYEVPNGSLLSKEEWDLLIAEAAFNQGNMREQSRISSTEDSDYGIRNPAEKTVRNYDGYFQESHWKFYEGRKAVYTLDSKTVSDDYGGYTHEVNEEEVWFITGNDEDGYGLYFNHYETINGIEGTPYTTEYSTSTTLETNPWDVGPAYDYYIVYSSTFGSNYVISLCFSPDMYDIEDGEVGYTSFVKTDDGSVYVTNYSTGTNIDEREPVNVDGVEITVPHHYLSGTQFVFKKVEGLGYCLAEYTTMSMDYMTVDYYGNRLSSPVVTHKEASTTSWTYAEKAPAYEGEEPAVITPTEDLYKVTLDVYDTYEETPTISYSENFNNITGLYKATVDSEFDGYAYQLIYYGYGIYKVGVAGPEGYTPLSLGWSDVTNYLDYNASVYASEELENGIQDGGYGYISYLILLSEDGALEKFSITYLI